MFQSKRKATWSYIIIVFLLICCYVGIYHSHRYFGFNWVMWLSISAMLALFYLGDLWLGDNGKWDKLKSVLLLFFVGGPIAIFVFRMHKSFIEKQLAEYGVHAQGLVTKLYIQRNKYSQTPYAVFTYKLNNKVWMQEVINRNSSLQVGDTLTLLCAKTDPEIFKIE